MMTRGDFIRPWSVDSRGITVPEVNAWREGAILTGGEFGLSLPPTVVMMDPSDPRTWRRPVRWT